MPVLPALVVGTTLFAVLVVPRWPAPPRPGRGAARHPGTWLLVVTALVLVNQVLFTVHVQREWGGDVSRIARYLPDGWFDLADLGWLAARFPVPELLGWTVLRAQALLELPLVLLAHLLVCRWCSAEAFRRAVGARWAASASMTATFCLVEWSLANPWTAGDIALRVVSGAVVPPLLARLAEGGGTPPRPVPFVLSTAAVGCLVLAVYDTALLYNLGHLGAWLPVVAAAAAALAAARRWAARPSPAPGPVTAAATAATGWFLVLFLVPALPLRYGLNFGAAPVSLLAGAVVVLAALHRGWPRDLLRPLLLAAAAGVGGAAPGYLVARGWTEARLLAAAVGFLLAALAACAAADRRAAPRPGATRSADVAGP